MNKIEIEKTKIIAVEGNDEVNFFEAFFEKNDINDFQIINFGGKYFFRKRILSLTKLDGFDEITHFGLIRDADENYNSAFESLIDSLKNADLPCPEKNNSFSEKNKLKVGIFIMPSKNEKGALENLCIEIIKEDKDFNCIKKFIDCLLNKPEKIEKSIIQIFLATKNPMVNSLGLGAKKGHFDFQNKKMKELLDFFKCF